MGLDSVRVCVIVGRVIGFSRIRVRCRRDLKYCKREVPGPKFQEGPIWGEKQGQDRRAWSGTAGAACFGGTWRVSARAGAKRHMPNLHSARPHLQSHSLAAHLKKWGLATACVRGKGRSAAIRECSSLLRVCEGRDFDAVSYGCLRLRLGLPPVAASRTDRRPFDCLQEFGVKQGDQPQHAQIGK